MPLRAKIQNPAFGRAQLSSSSSRRADMVTDLAGDDPEDVLFSALYGVRTIELNRPHKLNSLDGSMARKIVPRLQEWKKSDMANVIVIKGAGPKAFCAGGDVASLAKQNQEGPEGQAKSAEFFALEYKLNHMIASYQKPFVAFMDGITMGGGVGLSIHAPFRIATERTVFAMPETTIGFFPDVGASFFLSRMPGGLGTYLGLTSHRLNGVNAYYSGIATHFIHSTTLPMLEARLAELRFQDFQSLRDRLDMVNSTIGEFFTGLTANEPIQLGGDIRKAIDRCFTKTTIPEMMDALRAEAETADEPAVQKWAAETLATLEERSPTSLFVTLRLLQLGKNWSIKEALQREYLLAAKFMAHPDFTEGVSARLISKPARTPAWQPASIQDVAGTDPSRAMLSTANSKRLDMLTDADFRAYPHRYGMPAEADVKEALAASGGNLTPKQLVHRVASAHSGKPGVEMVVRDIVARKVVKVQDKRSSESRYVWEDDAPQSQE